MTAKHSLVVLITITLALASAAVHQAAAQAACANPQSPRNIDRNAVPSPYHHTSNISLIKSWGLDQIVYQPRGGGPEQTLYLCSMHYHYPIENDQGCAPAPGGAAGRGGLTPRLGERVEMHDVYAARVRAKGCDFHGLDCCLQAPFLVIATQMTVTYGAAGSRDARHGRATEPPPGSLLAEWSGSTTGRDASPGQCKPAAQWVFVLGCGMTVPVSGLEMFYGHGEEPRQLQPESRLSRDLTLVTRSTN